MSYLAEVAQDRSFEESALVLGRDLRADGYRDLAAALLEVVPETGTVRDDAHRAVVAERLHGISAADHVPSRFRERATQLASLASTDATIRHGRTGTVWIAWEGRDSDNAEDPAGEDGSQPGYWVSWQSDRGQVDWCEDGPYCADLRDALAWARARTDAVIVRPAWDENTHYWAGRGHDQRNLPPLDESRA